MPSFDIVNEVDLQEVDNAVNNTKREVATRYDFRQTRTEVEFNRKEKHIALLTGDDMKMEALKDMMINHFIKRSIDPKCIDFGENEGTAQGQIKCSAALQEGIARDIAQKIVKQIKGLKTKVQPSIQEDQVRVTGKKIDDLQSVISAMKSENFGIPLQFTNMKK
tara:strand:+ start:272 stop:763 length:492 start_codon:yes stop_codon:yes gene_type:complete